MNREKFNNLILYIADKGKGDARLGKTKLNKLLYFIDFGYFREHAESITGAEYMAIENGPAPRHMLPAFQQLQEDGALDWAQIPTGLKNPLAKPVAMVKPDLSHFTSEEVSFIDEIIGKYERLNGTELADLSHSEPGYDVANDRETIPYGTAFFPPSVTPDGDDMALLDRLANEHGWQDRYAA